ncbi:protein of unknown function [Bhargavaea beijingensis]|uniref:DUF3784 domain-containing protein n=1 Tax=Bhargavaea beijingensis TaxID=426756 RepID=A0A1G6Y975_9BACL|nr:DUF3784 domain-containing protein [Bhargavaea beijingensis]SDD86543.1 protein of unknown function [Bhargavaea beijingensis]
MTVDMIVIGLIFFVLGYLIGVKKMTFLLAGFNEQRVRDKDRLGLLVGGALGVLGAIMLIAGLLGAAPAQPFIVGSVIVMLLLVVYVNAKMVE